MKNRMVALFAGLVLTLTTSVVSASVVRAVPANAQIQSHIEAAEPGTTLVLAPGEYSGPLLIDKPLHLTGEDATIIGTGSGSVITITASDVHIKGLTITHSGTDLPAMDSDILVTRTADRVDIRDQHVAHNHVAA